MATEDFHIDVVDLKIAPRTGAATWGTALDVIAIDTMEVSIESIQAELPGDGGIADAYARVQSATIRIQFGFYDLEVPAAIVNQSVASSGGDKSLKFDTDKLPYIALIGKVQRSNTAGCAHIFIPKMKLRGSFTFSAGQGRYVTPQLEFRAVREDSTYGVVRMYEYDDDTSLVIPPTLPGA